MSEQLPGLPGHCTEITVQKKNSDRVSLFVEGRFLNGFHRKVIEEAGIRKGTLITKPVYDELIRAEELHRIKEQIYRWLAKRDHASGEIRNKSHNRGFSPENTETVIREFRDKGLLDDREFAGKYAGELSGRKGWGPLKIHAALSQKGVKKSYIDSVLADLFDDQKLEDELSSAAMSARNRLMRTEPGIKRKQKLVNFLIQRGFPGPLVYEKCDHILRKLENEETEY